MISQILVAIAETYFFGRLGTEALAGFALVYPFMMLMQVMASGGMGAASPRQWHARWAASAWRMRVRWYRTRSCWV
jgi:hypothetical protein